MKKIQSFSLIEIMIASSIFMLVAMMAAASFAMVRRANDKAHDLKNTGECREILQNYVESGVKNSNTTPRVMGIIAQGDIYKFKDIKIIDNNASANLILPESYQFSGLAMIQDDGSYLIIYKDKNQNYLYKEIKLGEGASMPVEGDNVPTADKFLKTGNETCFSSPTSLESAKPFQIWGVKNNRNQNLYLITVILEDNLYSIQNPTSQDQNFSHIYLRVTNGEGNF